MKKTMLLVLALSAISVLAMAEERLPLATEICYPATQLVSWNYVQSGNVSNGALDHRAYIEMSFAPVGNVSERVILPVKGLVWDKNFRHVIRANENDRTTVCASKSVFGKLRKNLDNCRLEGLFSAPLILEANNCDGRDPVRFSAELIIAD